MHNGYHTTDNRNYPHLDSKLLRRKKYAEHAIPENNSFKDNGNQCIDNPKFRILKYVVQGQKGCKTQDKQCNGQCGGTEKFYKQGNAFGTISKTGPNIFGKQENWIQQNKSVKKEYNSLTNFLSNMFIQSPFRCRSIIRPVFVYCCDFTINNFYERCHMK